MEKNYVANFRIRDDVPLLNYKQIEDIAYQVLVDVCPERLNQCKPIPVDLIMEKSFGLHIEAQTMMPDGSILGQTYFQDREDFFCTEDISNICWKKILVRRKTVVIDSYVYENQPQRFSFTAAHELGHWILHQSFYTQNTEVAARTQSLARKNITIRPKTPIEWTEFQADNFAGCFLLPRDIVRPVVKKYLEDYKLHYKALLNFENPMMRSLFIELTETVAKTLGVSRDCAHIRLERLFKVKYPTGSYNI